MTIAQHWPRFSQPVLKDLWGQSSKRSTQVPLCITAILGSAEKILMD